MNLAVDIGNTFIKYAVFENNKIIYTYRSHDIEKKDILDITDRYSIERYEPRVLLTKVQVVPDYDGNAFDVQIVYNIIGIDVPSQQLEFVLQSTSQ